MDYGIRFRNFVYCYNSQTSVRDMCQRGKKLIRPRITCRLLQGRKDSVRFFLSLYSSCFCNIICQNTYCRKKGKHLEYVCGPYIVKLKYFGYTGVVKNAL